MPVNPLGRTQPVVDEQGRATQELNLFSEEVAQLPIIIGAGSPEGVVQARQSRLYMDSTGSAGSILYVKKLADIGGDKSEGWILV